jgi:glycosyltransferase involved in cell wall biosynthesis
VSGVPVSVVLPTYNRAATLTRAIESVLTQTFPHFELIVVDDGSTDDSPAILRRYERVANVRVVRTPHRGCAAARNTGIALAKTDYVAFQDSDDEWEPRKLAVAMAALDGTGPDTGVFYSDMRVVLPDGRWAVMPSPVVSPNALIDEQTLDYQVRCIGIQSAVIKRECFDRVGTFDEALPRFVDLDLFIRLSDVYRFVRSPEVLVRYNHLGSGITADRRALVEARRYLLQKYRHRLERHRHHLAAQYLFLAGALRENGQTLRSLPASLRALLIAPFRGRPAHTSLVGEWSYGADAPQANC